MTLRDEIAHLLHDPESMSLEIERQYYEKPDAIIALLRERLTGDEAVIDRVAEAIWCASSGADDPYAEAWEIYSPLNVYPGPDAKEWYEDMAKSAITAALDAVLPSEAKERGDGPRRS